MNIYTIILHLGDISITKDCIKSLKKFEKENTKILVVNNDRSILSGKEFGNVNIEIINNRKNLGFSRGVNMGIVQALKNGAESVFLLNNDVSFDKPILNKLIQDLKNNPKAGIVGPAIRFKKNQRSVFDIGGYINLLTGKTNHKEVNELKNFGLQYPDYITGAVMLIKKEVFEKVGLFDENFFLYYEDVDICLRAKEKGFTILVEPGVTVNHLLSKTIGKLNPFAVYHQTKSALIFGNKYYNKFPNYLLQRSFIIYQCFIFFFKSPRIGLCAFAAIYGSGNKKLEQNLKLKKR